MLSVLLMVAGLFLAIRRANRFAAPDTEKEKPQALGRHGSAVETRSGPTSDGRRREAAGRSWRHAEEHIEEGAPEPSGDFPVYLGYLQSDGTNQELRIGLRQETGAEFDVADLEIQVDLMDAGGNLLGPESKPKTDWVMETDEFSESQAPVMRVSSGVRVDRVGLTLRYRREEVERRRYVLAAPASGFSPEQGGEK